jgi:lipopolysaccharide biosynthesis glycosyltransferase
MMKKMNVIKSHDGGDQGFLNLYFSHWYRVPFFYNALLITAIDKNYRGAFRFQENKIKVLHYVHYKPWNSISDYYNELSESTIEDLNRLHSYWHRVYEQVKHKESKEDM